MDGVIQYLIRQTPTPSVYGKLDLNVSTHFVVKSNLSLTLFEFSAFTELQCSSCWIWIFDLRQFKFWSKQLICFFALSTMYQTNTSITCPQTGDFLRTRARGCTLGHYLVHAGQNRFWKVLFSNWPYRSLTPGSSSR